MYDSSEYLMISGIQHFVFCPRQWALIHVEGKWEENRLTMEGEIQHGRAHDESIREKRNDVLIVRGMRVSSPTLGIAGQCDVIEFRKTSDDDGAILHGHRGRWIPCPVEYKHGKDKEDDSDIMQLCLEAMCLSEMLATRVDRGRIFYHEIRRSREIDITDELRERAAAMLSEMHDYFDRGHTPRVKPSRKCRSCSLKGECMPALLKNKSARKYIIEHMRGDSA